MKKVYASGELAEFANKQKDLKSLNCMVMMRHNLWPMKIKRVWRNYKKITRETADNSRFMPNAKSSYIIIYILPIWIISYYL